MEITDSDYAEPKQQIPTTAVGISGTPSPSSSKTLSLEHLAVVLSFHGELPEPSGAAAEVPGDGNSTACESCGGLEIGPNLVVCDGCERSFHLECSGIQESEPEISDEWLCKECLSNGVSVKRWLLGPKSNAPGHGLSGDLHGSGEGTDSPILRKQSPDDNIFYCNLFGGSVTYSDSWHVENLLGFGKEPEVDTPADKLFSKETFHSSDSANISFEEEDIWHLIGKLRCTSQPSSCHTLDDGLLLGTIMDGAETRKTKLRTSGKDRIQLIDKPVMESRCIPPGRPIFSELPSDLVGDVLQVWEFLNRFHVVLGFGSPLSIEELEKGLRCRILDGSGTVQQNEDSLQRANGEATHTRIEFSKSSREGMALNEVHCSLLRVLIGELQPKVAAIVQRNFDVEKVKPQKSKKKDVNVSVGKDTKWNVPVNEGNWQHLACQHLLALLSMDRSCESPKVAIHHSGNAFCCLPGDGPDPSMLCGSLTGLVGMEADASLLAQALRKIYGHINRENDMLFIVDEDPKISGDCRNLNSSNGDLPAWAELLQPVRTLRTNVGARIRNCVRNALEEGPPEWAKQKLEHSISKEVYKGNASGPTKRAVLEVLADVCGKGKQQESYKAKKKNYACISDLIMKKCRSVLRVAATDDRAKFFYNLRWGQLTLDDAGILGASAVSRPLDFRTIDMRLAVGAYDGSHEAFLEDVQELWSQMRVAYSGHPGLLFSVDELSSEFETLYQKEVLRLRQKLVGYAKLGCLTAASKKEVDSIIDFSSKLPKAPWEDGICKICGIDEHDGKVLLCDGHGCDDEYHIYCLNPPFPDIPKGCWFCASCTAKNGNSSDALECAPVVSPAESKCHTDMIRLASMLEAKEYCQLGIEERISLLKFLCDELLDSQTIRKHILNSEEPYATLQQQSSSDPTELRNSKNNETNTDTQSSGNFSRHIELSLRREFLGRDSTGRLYWILGSLGRYQWIIVSSREKEKQWEEEEITLRSEASSASPIWLSYQSREEVNQLMKYLRDDHPSERALKDSILRLNLIFEDVKQPGKQGTGDSELSFSGSANRANTLCSRPLDTKAASFLEKEFGPYNVPESIDSMKKREKVVCAEKYFFRCSCLELVWTSRHHCLSCHRTFSSAAKLEGHSDSLCGFAPPVPKIIKETIVPKVQDLMGSGDALVKCNSEIVGFEPSQSGYLSSKSNLTKPPSDILNCPPDFEEICARFQTNNSNRELVQEIGCIRSKEVELIDSESAYLNYLEMILPVPGRDSQLSNEDRNRNRSIVPTQGNIRPALGSDKSFLGQKGKTASCLSHKDLVTGNCRTIPKAALELVVGKDEEILNKLKASLLDMDDALPEAALRPSKANVERRWAWRAFVKSAKSIYEVVQAIIAFEDTIRSDYFMNGGSYCSSVSAACSISTVTALALRIDSLDASICYEKKPGPEQANGSDKLKPAKNLKRKRGCQKPELVVEDRQSKGQTN